MGEAALRGEVVAALAEADHLVDTALESDMAPHSDADIAQACRALERLRRRLAALEHQLIDQLTVRGIPTAAGASSTTAYLRGALNIDAGQAAARVRLAHEVGPRRGLTGAALTPAFPQVGEALRAGMLSEAHAQVIVRTMRRLPEPVRTAQGTQIEGELTGYALRFEPRSLAQIAARLAYCYDQDGTLVDAEARERHREVSVRARADGSAILTGELTAECAERLLTHFDALAAPVTAAGAVPDDRSAGQRRHDALLAMLELQQRAGVLANTGGVSTTVVLTMSAEAFRTGEGLAGTGHGALVPARHALRWGGADKRVLACAVDRSRRVVAHGHTRRLFTENQRLALTARDGGCTFPGCGAGPAWCHIHHIREFSDGGPTRLDNAAMVCPYHHRVFATLGWRPELIDNRVAWHPPPWMDPDRAPRFNHLHDVILRT